MCVYEATEIINAISSVVQTVVKVQEIRIEKAENEYNAQMMVSKAKRAENQAAYERQEGIEDARKQRLNAILTSADTKVEIASGNLGVSSMTSLNLLQDDKEEGERDAEKTLRTSEYKASNYIDSANNYYKQSALYTFRSKYVYRNDLFDAYSKGAIGVAKSIAKMKGKQK